jgi:hypothetical protein
LTRKFLLGTDGNRTNKSFYTSFAIKSKCSLQRLTSASVKWYNLWRQSDHIWQAFKQAGLLNAMSFLHDRPKGLVSHDLQSLTHTDVSYYNGTENYTVANPDVWLLSFNNRLSENTILMTFARIKFRINFRRMQAAHSKIYYRVALAF